MRASFVVGCRLGIRAIGDLWIHERNREAVGRPGNRGALLVGVVANHHGKEILGRIGRAGPRLGEAGLGWRVRAHGHVVDRVVVLGGLRNFESRPPQ